MQKDQSKNHFFLDNVQIDPSRNLICAHDDAVRVELKVMALLLRLKQNMGQTLSRSQLIESLWDDNSGSDEALTQTVSKLRKALGDNSSIIETVPKRGYRLKFELDGALKPRNMKTNKRRFKRQTHLLWSAIALLLVMILYTNLKQPVLEQYEIEILLD